MPVQIIYLVVLLAAFYFLLIRPQQQQAKRQQQVVNSLEPGVEIVTVGGIYATVVEVEDERIRVAVADGSELEIARRAVASVVPAKDEAEAEDDEDLAEEPELASADADHEAEVDSQDE